MFMLRYFLCFGLLLNLTKIVNDVHVYIFCIQILIHVVHFFYDKQIKNDQTLNLM